MVFMATMFGSVAALVYLVNTNRVASIVYNAALKNKAQSESFMHRVEADTYALKILINRCASSASFATRVISPIEF